MGWLSLISSLLGSRKQESGQMQQVSATPGQGGMQQIQPNKKSGIDVGGLVKGFMGISGKKKYSTEEGATTT